MVGSVPLHLIDNSNGSESALNSNNISAKVAALTEGVLKSMLLTKLKFATAVLVVVALLGAAVGTSLGPVLGQTPVDPKAPKPPAAAERRSRREGR